MRAVLEIIGALLFAVCIGIGAYKLMDWSLKVRHEADKEWENEDEED